LEEGRKTLSEEDLKGIVAAREEAVERLDKLVEKEKETKEADDKLVQEIAGLLKDAEEEMQKAKDVTSLLDESDQQVLYKQFDAAADKLKEAGLVAEDIVEANIKGGVLAGNEVYEGYHKQEAENGEFPCGKLPNLVMRVIETYSEHNIMYRDGLRHRSVIVKVELASYAEALEIAPWIEGESLEQIQLRQLIHLQLQILKSAQ